MPHNPRVILLTGGAGFIGCNLARHLLNTHRSARIVVLDALTYAGHRANLSFAERARPDVYRFVEGDIADAVTVNALFDEERPDTVIHLAAESHVDRSIDDPLLFIRTNVVGTATLLNAARRIWQKVASLNEQSVRFHHVSTDEVFGSLGPSGRFDESTPYDPSSPYSASKASSDHLVRAWGRTYGMPYTISNCSNNYGPNQFPEKLIPLIIHNALAGKPLPVYGAGLNVRDWLYVLDHAEAIDRVVCDGKAGETYCVGGDNECRNIDIVHAICDNLDQLRPDPLGSYRRLIAHVADRPGHDLRYAIDAGRIQRDLGWKPRQTFVSGLRLTIEWYLDNQSWLDDLHKRHQDGHRQGLSAT